MYVYVYICMSIMYIQQYIELYINKENVKVFCCAR